MAEKSTAKEALKKLDAQLECSLCLDNFKEPKLLPCFHVFCKSPCLEKLVAKDGQSLQCPTCRQLVPLPVKGVSGLQSDFHIDHLFEIRDAFNKAAESTETQCDSCEDGKATGYCRDCGDFVCDDCQAAHNRLRRMKNYQIITLEEVQAQATNLIPPKKAVPRCLKHLNKKLKIYCETCGELICSDCTIRRHKDHNYNLVGEVFTKHKEEIVSGLKPVKEKLDNVQQALQVFDTRAKEINEQRVTVEANIHKEFDQQQRLLDQQRIELVGELDSHTQQKLKSLAAQRDQVEIAQVKLTSCLEYAEGGLETGTEGEVLAMKAPVLKRIEQINAEFDPATIQPETKADIQLLTDGKEQLQKAYHKFAEITEVEAVSLENSYISEGDLEGAAKVGEQKSAEFHARTKTSKQFKKKLDLTAELMHTKSTDRIRCEVVKQKNGTHKINYQPNKRGKHELRLTINSSPVRGSPYPITVTPSPQSLCKPVRVVGGLNQPRGTAINSKGQVVVVEKGGSCISILTPEGERIRSFGTKGSGNGQLSNAFGVTVDNEDNIYVLDYNNYRVQKFTSEGQFVAAVGSQGSNHLQFNSPVGICFNKANNALYVCDNGNHRIQVLSTDLTFKSSFGTQGNGNGQFQNPRDAALDDANNLYVTEYYSHRVQVFTAEGRFLRAFTNKAIGEKLKNAWSIAIDSSNTVYVSESGPHSVSVFTSQGDYITSFGKQGAEEGQFTNIYGLTVDRNDSIIVSDQGNGRLQIF